MIFRSKVSNFSFIITLGGGAGQCKNGEVSKPIIRKALKKLAKSACKLLRSLRKPLNSLLGVVLQVVAKLLELLNPVLQPVLGALGKEMLFYHSAKFVGYFMLINFFTGSLCETLKKLILDTLKTVLDVLIKALESLAGGKPKPKIC